MSDIEVITKSSKNVNWKFNVHVYINIVGILNTKTTIVFKKYTVRKI